MQAKRKKEESVQKYKPGIHVVRRKCESMGKGEGGVYKSPKYKSRQRDFLFQKLFEPLRKHEQSCLNRHTHSMEIDAILRIAFNYFISVVCLIVPAKDLLLQLLARQCVLRNAVLESVLQKVFSSAQHLI